MWNRKLWGIEYRSKTLNHIIGNLWNYSFAEPHKGYDGEPTHALLFTTRAAAREWCKSKGNSSSLHVVRVREIVRTI